MGSPSIHNLDVYPQCNSYWTVTDKAPEVHKKTSLDETLSNLKRQLEKRRDFAQLAEVFDHYFSKKRVSIWRFVPVKVGVYKLTITG